MNCQLVLLFAIAVAMAGCEGGGGNGADTIDDTDDIDSSEPWDSGAIAGCELVTDDEILGALGEPVTEREEGGWYGCELKTDSNFVDLRIFPDTSLPEETCSENQSSMPYGQSAKGRLQPVRGLGDAAIWGSSGDLLVCTDRGLLVVSFEYSAATMSTDDEKEAAIAIAGHALQRLD